MDIQVTSFDRQVKKSGGLFARSQRGKFHRYCPRFKARGVNGRPSHAVCDAVAMLNNLSIVICTLSILPAKHQFVELYGEPKVSGI